MRYIIKDWAGNTMHWDNNPYDSFDDACDALCSEVSDITIQELADGDTEYRDYDFDELWEINLDEFQIIEIEGD